MKLNISDITITRREVEIPDHCPACKADLNLPNGLIEWVMQDQAYRGQFEEDGIFYFEDMLDAGDCFENVGWNCICGHILATGKYEVK